MTRSVRKRFWTWLMRFAYRRAADAQRVPAAGTPGVRDPDARCPDYAPRQALHGDWSNCETDGHYLCRGCAHRSPSLDLGDCERCGRTVATTDLENVEGICRHCREEISTTNAAVRARI